MAEIVVACVKTDCRWNREGACNARQIFIDQGPRCASYEPNAQGAPATSPLSPTAQAVRQLLLARMAAGGPGPTPGPASGALPGA